jgi:hypothetical protein
MRRIEPDGRVTAAQFFLVSAVLEVGAGLALLAAPALIIRLLFGPVESQTAIALGRLAGAALLSLAAACWFARDDGGSAAARGLVSGMLIYNAAIVALVLSSGFGPISPALWGAVMLHGAMAIWSVWSLRVAVSAAARP